MSPNPRPIAYSDIEVRSYLPSGWNLPDPWRRGWDSKSASWTSEVSDGAENVWTVRVAAEAASAEGRLEALKRSFDRLQRKALGRHSVLTG